jgi:hypothetical protein
MITVGADELEVGAALRASHFQCHRHVARVTWHPKSLPQRSRKGWRLGESPSERRRQVLLAPAEKVEDRRGLAAVACKSAHKAPLTARTPYGYRPLPQMSTGGARNAKTLTASTGTVAAEKRTHWQDSNERIAALAVFPHSA